MFRRVLNSVSNSITGAAIIIAGATLISRLVGLLRDRILAHTFGAGPVMDAYYAAFKIPDLIYNLLVVGALSAGFIPIFTRLYHQKDQEEAWHLAGNVFNIIGVALGVLSVVGIIFAPTLVQLVAPGFNTQTLQLTVSFVRIMFLSPFLLGLSMVLGGILQSLRRFVIYSLSPIFYNIGIIIGATLLYPWIGQTGLAWGVVLGAVLHLSVQLYGAVLSGFKWKPLFNWRDPNTRAIGRMMIPRTLGLAAANINTIIFTVLCSLLPAGSVAIYNYADNLQWVPIGIIGIPFALAAFPALSYAAALKDWAEMSRRLSETARKILFLIIPLSLIFLLLRAQIVRVVLGSGAFDWTATINTADTLAFFALGLFAQALIPLFARAFYALGDSKTPFMAGVSAVLINIVLALALMKQLGVAGLALSASVGAIFNLTVLAIVLRGRIKSLEENTILSALGRISIAALFMGMAIQWLKYPLAEIFNQRYFWGIFGQGAVAGLAGLVVYGLICYILKLPEMLDFINSFHKRWLKLRNVPTEVVESKE